MKFTIFVLGFIFLATPQYSFGQQNALETDKLIQYINKSSGLEAGNTRLFGGITNKVGNAINQATTKVINTSTGIVSQGVNTVLDKTGASDVMNNVQIPIPISLNNTSVGNLLNKASLTISSAAGHLGEMTLSLNESFQSLTDTAENFVTKHIFQANPDTNSICRTIPSDILEPTFTEGIFKNTKSCFSSVLNIIKKHSLIISELQSELNNVVQFGSLRVALMFDIKRAVTNLQNEIAIARQENPECDLSLVTSTVNNMSRLLFTWLSRCYGAIINKVFG